MITLTTTDRIGFSAAQITAAEKFGSTRLDKDSDFVGSEAAYREMMLAKWRKMPAAKIRAKVCFGSVSQGQISWSSECDLTTAEKVAVQDLLVASGGKPIDIIVDVIGGKRSVEQRLAALEA